MLGRPTACRPTEAVGPPWQTRVRGCDEDALRSPRASASQGAPGEQAGGARLLLLDGHSLAYRAFFALPTENFSTTSGQTTNAVYGFTSMLINLLRDEAPTHVCVAFDVSRQSFRTETFAAYKANRSATPGRVPRPDRPDQGHPGDAEHPRGHPRGVRGGRRHRHAHHAGHRRGHARLDLHGRPRRLPAGHRPGDGALPAQGRLGPRALHPRGRRGALHAHPGAVPGLRRAAGRPERQPPEHPRGRREDRAEVDPRVRVARRAGRAGRRGAGQGGRRAARAPVLGGAQPSAHRAGPRRRARRDARPARGPLLGPRQGAPALRRARVPRPARAPVLHAHGRRARGRGGLRAPRGGPRAGRGRRLARRARARRRPGRHLLPGHLGPGHRGPARGRPRRGRRRGAPRSTCSG